MNLSKTNNSLNFVESKSNFLQVFNEAKMVEDKSISKTLFVTIELLKKVLYFYKI